MKSIQLIFPQKIEESPLQLSESPLPEPAGGEVRVRIESCGICHTDLHVIEGDLPPKRSPLIPGHQIVGVIDKLGAGINTRAVGERVGVAWMQWTCGACAWCLRGEENLCENAHFTGYDRDGGFCEFAVAPANFVYSIPAGFSSDHAAPLLCAGIIGYRSLKLSGIKEGERLGIFGFGASAHLTIQVARSRKCEVFVFSRSPGHRKLAEHFGAVWTGTPDDSPPYPVDAAISFAPVGEIVPAALRALRKGGTLALAGITMTPLPSLEYSLLYHERRITSVTNNTRDEALEFLRVAEAIPIRTEIEVFPFSDANKALQLLKQGKISGAGVLSIG